MTVLFAFLISFSAGAWFQPTEVCQPPLDGPVSLFEPFPHPGFQQRHEEIRAAILARSADFQRCRERLGAFEQPLALYVDEDGDIYVPATDTEAAACVARILREIDVGPFHCAFNFPYMWFGDLP